MSVCFSIRFLTMSSSGMESRTCRNSNQQTGNFCFMFSRYHLFHTGCLHTNSSHWLRHHSMSESRMNVKTQRLKWISSKVDIVYYRRIQAIPDANTLVLFLFSRHHLLLTGCFHSNSSHWLGHHLMSESIMNVIIPDIRLGIIRRRRDSIMVQPNR